MPFFLFINTEHMFYIILPYSIIYVNVQSLQSKKYNIGILHLCQNSRSTNSVIPWLSPISMRFTFGSRSWPNSSRIMARSLVPPWNPWMTRIRYTPLSAARIRPSMASFASSPFSPWTSISIIPPVSAFSFMYPSPFLPYLKFIIPKCRPVFKLL